MTIINDKYMKNGQYINVNEMLRSQTAEKLNIKNVPNDPIVIENLEHTIEQLDELRRLYDHPILITSGYRCPALNKAVGGKPNSQHVKGQAADLKWDENLLQFIIDNYHYDQLIEETSKRTKWIHISFNKEKERMQYIKLKV